MTFLDETRKKFGVPEKIILDPTLSSDCKQNLIKFINLVGSNLPEDIPRDLWIKYATANSYDLYKGVSFRTKMNSIGDWINHGFTWADTDEGHDFWDKLFSKYHCKELVIKYKLKKS